MYASEPQHVSREVRRTLAALCCVALALLTCSCAAASRPADPNRPRADAPAYPLVLEASEERREKALAAWSVIAGEQPAANAARPELRPVTATIESLPPAPAAPPRMPKVGAGEARSQTDEETRESLRRFIETAAPLLGLERRAPVAGATERDSTLGDLSLVEVAEGPNATKLARYRQNPFDLPLRNGFGDIEVAFTPDLSVTRLKSTAVPDTERLRRAVTAVRQGLAQDKLAASLLNRTLTFADAAGNPQTRTVSSVESVVVRELVVFPQRRAGADTQLELRLAWELSIEGQGAPLVAYVDAVTGEQLTETGRQGDGATGDK